MKYFLYGEAKANSPAHSLKPLAQNPRSGIVTTMDFPPKNPTPPLGNTRPGPLPDIRERRGLRVSRESAHGVKAISDYLGQFSLRKFRSIDGKIYEVDAILSTGTDDSRTPWSMELLPELKLNISVPLCQFQRADNAAQPLVYISGVVVDYLNPRANILTCPNELSRIYLRCTVDDTLVAGLVTTRVDIVALDRTAAAALVNLPTQRFIPLGDVDFLRRQKVSFYTGPLATVRWGDRRQVNNMHWYPLYT